MKNKWKLLTIIGTIFVFLAVGTTLIVNSQRQDKQNSQLQAKQELQRLEQDAPIANYNEPLPNNIEERIKREKRNRANNTKIQPPNNPKQFMLTERRESNYGLIPSHTSIQPAIPARRSDAVIIGEIINGEAHLSEDKISIYSEFAVRNPVVFKNITPESINAERPTVVSHFGGGVRFPSSKVIYNLVLGKPMPQMGKTYLFFLKYSDEVGFSIITAYELMQGRVFPLDGLTPNGSVIKQYAGHQSFRGAPANDFLNRVKEAVANNSDIFIG